MERGHPCPQAGEARSTFPSQSLRVFALRAQADRMSAIRYHKDRSCVAKYQLLRAVRLRRWLAKVVAQQHTHRNRYPIAHGGKEVHLLDRLGD